MKLKLKKKAKVKVKGNGKVNKRDKVVGKNKGINITLPLEEVILINKVIAKSEKVIEALEEQLKQKEEACEYYRVLSERRKLNC